MSLPAQNPYPQQVAAANQKVFLFGWRCDDAGTVTVWVNDGQDGGFTVTLNPDQTGSPGGSITRAVGCAAGDVVTIERTSAQVQTFGLTAYTPYTAAALSLALDRMVEMVQELWARFARVFTVKRSQQSKIDSFELPVPIAGQAIGWASTDGGSHFHLDNLGTLVFDTVANTTLVPNEVPTGAVNGTTGSDGNTDFALTHIPRSQVLTSVYVDGVKQPLTRYSIQAGNLIRFVAPFIPAVGSQIYVDYYF